MPRLFDPPSFINAHTEEAIATLPGFAWDVVPASCLLSALGVEDKMVVNRWLYRGAAGTPPFEPPGRWRTGQGAPRVIRKDRALAWACSGGANQAPSECWPFAARDLGLLGWPDLDGPDQVQQTLGFLLDNGILKLRFDLADWSQRLMLY